MLAMDVAGPQGKSTQSFPPEGDKALPRETAPQSEAPVTVLLQHIPSTPKNTLDIGSVFSVTETGQWRREVLLRPQARHRKAFSGEETELGHLLAEVTASFRLVIHHEGRISHLSL